MKTVYLHADTLDSVRQDLLAAGVLLPYSDAHGVHTVPSKGVTFVEVGKIEESPAVFDASLQLITPAVYQPGEFANLTFTSDIAADDFKLLFSPAHGTEILSAPNNPVSVLLAGGGTPGSVATPFVSQKVPESWVSRRAFFLSLYEVAAISPDQIRAGLAGNIPALIEFEAPYFDPANPLFLQLATDFGVSEEQLALIWAKARRL